MPIEHEFLAPDPGSSKDDHHGSHKEPDSQRMTNADFRKIMMTPRSDKNMTAMGALGSGNSTLGGTTPKVGGTSSSGSGQGTASENKELSEKAEKRKKEKKLLCKIEASRR